MCRTINKKYLNVKTPKWLSQFITYSRSPQGQPIIIKIKIGAINASGVFVTEILFTMVPVLVLAMIHLFKGANQSIWSIPEWSFMAAVLFGQAIPRMFDVLAETSRSFNPKTTSAIASLVIVLGLVPSLIFLCLILLSENPSIWLICGQLFMFVLSIFTLLAFIFMKHIMPEVGEISEALWPEYIEAKTIIVPQPGILPTEQGKNPPTH